MATIILPLLVAVAGALVFALSANPKLARIGEILFFCGTFVTLEIAARLVVHLP